MEICDTEEYAIVYPAFGTKAKLIRGNNSLLFLDFMDLLTMRIM